ncbi:MULTISPECIES: inner membrane protein YbjM [unclassified Serratia (in: enterobacteria)]|uniref:inner membrane protein YbjM n=1 Tax=unclassified Serratia (in: enterobacteria) TaxID=2647522 RepID=UPI0030762B47
MANYRYWVGILSSFLLFSLIFLAQKGGVFNGAGTANSGETGLLLFVIPGVIASHLSSKKRILCPLLGALYAVPLCFFIRYFWLMPGYSYWQELAYSVSAVFWCAFGAMLYLFIRVAIHALQRFCQRERQ